MPWTEIHLLTNILARTVRHYERSNPSQYSDKSLIDSRRPITLEEKDINASLRTIPVDGVSSDGLVLKLDNFGISCFAKGTANKACDYLILTEKDTIKYALFIEIKSSIFDNPDTKGNLQLTNPDDIDKACQLNGGCALLEYLNTILDVFYGKRHVFSSNNCTRLFFVLYNQIHAGVRGPIQSISGACNSSALSLKNKDISAIKVSNLQTLSIDDFLNA